ncbi:hypothetical protein K2173_012468 [Erythroxylum novogranatense]|uniref:Uncharacterized protein n=1 Tax=Erythroxylum novogranatense TaxID=1862640 RepID=A0AAV8U888_9ROSI|nr:hypothetical protein K2173_012468 [Erythroxylum novogranatense]
MEFKDKIENLIKHKSSLQRDNIWTSGYSYIESDIATLDCEELVPKRKSFNEPLMNYTTESSPYACNSKMSNNVMLDSDHECLEPTGQLHDN